MSYGSAFLEQYGLKCTIERTPPVPTKTLLKRASNASNPATREAAWDGQVPAEAALQSGEIIAKGSDAYLTQSTEDAGDITLYRAVKCNVTLTHQRYTEDVVDGNLIQQWGTVNAGVKAWGQAVTAALRQTNPGLLPGTKYLFELPKALGVVEMDRLVYGTQNLRVDALDDITLSGVVRVQCGVDVR